MDRGLRVYWSPPDDAVGLELRCAVCGAPEMKELRVEDVEEALRSPDLEDYSGMTRALLAAVLPNLGLLVRRIAEASAETGGTIFEIETGDGGGGYVCGSCLPKLLEANGDN